MDIRKFNVYIDGVCLPRWLLTDTDTQVNRQSSFTFDGEVERYPPHPDADYVSVFEVPLNYENGPWFANLDGRALTFMSQMSEYETSFKISAIDAGLSLAFPNEEVDEDVVMQHSWWELEWGREYVVYVDGADSLEMTIEARRCRMPLRNVTRSLMNGMNRVSREPL